MKVWPFAAALAEGGCKPPHAALAEDRRGERCGKGARDASGGGREDGAQSSFSGIAVDVSLLNKVASKPGCSRSAASGRHRCYTLHGMCPSLDHVRRIGVLAAAD